MKTPKTSDTRMAARNATFLALMVFLAIAWSRALDHYGVSLTVASYGAVAGFLAVTTLLLTVVQARLDGADAELRAFAASVLVPLCAAVALGLLIGRSTRPVSWVLGVATSWLLFLTFSMFNGEARRITARSKPVEDERVKIAGRMVTLNAREIRGGEIAYDVRTMTLVSLAPAAVLVAFRLLGKLALNVGDLGWFVALLGLESLVALVFMAAWLLTTAVDGCRKSIARTAILAPFAALVIFAPITGVGRTLWAPAFAFLFAFASVAPMGALVRSWIGKINNGAEGACLLTRLALVYFTWRHDRMTVELNWAGGTTT